MLIRMSSSLEDALRERIKELTCLYEVSSILVNANLDEQKETFKAIAVCLKKAFQHPEFTEISINQESAQIHTGKNDINKSISAPINLFNKHVSNVHYLHSMCTLAHNVHQ